MRTPRRRRSEPSAQPPGPQRSPLGMRRTLVPATIACLLLAGCTQPPHASQRAIRAIAPSRCTGVGQAIQALNSGAELTGVQFISAEQGWVVGRQRILATTNGGQTWTVQDRGTLDLSSVDFIDRTLGWAVGAGMLLTTADAGRSWTTLPEPCPLLLRSVHFVTPGTGFAIAGGSSLIDHGGLAPAASGVLLTTVTGGRSWRRLTAPADPQTVCFNTPANGWLGANGGLYRSTNDGRTWTLAAAGPRPVVAGYPYTMFVQCAGADSVWATDVGPGGGMSQEPHIGYHGGPAGAGPIFAEQYFPHPGVSVQPNSPGSYAGVMSAISPTAAVYLDWCAACGYGSVPWDLATDSGQTLVPNRAVGGLTYPSGASFLTPERGWVIGTLATARGYFDRIVRTVDGGRSWQLQYPGG